MIQLGRDFNMNVLAEGIETAGIQQRLVEMGCEYGQGYLISRPMPADQVIEWMDNTDWNRSDRTE
jgi:EAL domain-containing protein (putative c-di-GMP-specific phosphodiesterase class I)